MTTETIEPIGIAPAREPGAVQAFARKAARGFVTHVVPPLVILGFLLQSGYAGRVYAVETAVDERTRTVLLRGRVANRGARLRPGMFARVTLELGATAQATLIPEQAIVPRGGRNYVFRVVKGRAALTEVVLGTRSPGQVEIVKGLKAGELVVTDGQIRLQDGASVMVLPDKPPPTAAPSVSKG